MKRNFKIVSAGWECADWFEQTLQSVAMQTVDDWEIWVTYDPSEDDGGERIQAWCDARDSRWHCTINTEKKWATRNHYESITQLAPAADDVIVFLDLDGDMLAHANVLERIGWAYDQGALVTYGQYRPVPDMGTSGPAQPYPAEIVRNNSYREYHRTGGAGFNHPRTMAGAIFNAIPEESFRWQHSGSKRLPTGKDFSWQAGEFYQGSTDYLFMVPALELAGGRHHCFGETLLLYNHAQPHADNKTHPQEAHVCLLDFYSRAPLAPLVPGVVLS